MWSRLILMAMEFFKAKSPTEAPAAPRPSAGAPAGPVPGQAAEPEMVSAAANFLQSKYQEILQKAGRGAGDLASEVTDAIVEAAVLERASDVHIEAHGSQLRIRCRVDGVLQEFLNAPLHPDIPLAKRFRVLAGFDPNPPIPFRVEDGRFTKNIQGRPIQIRVSAFPTVNGEKIVLRVLDQANLLLGLEQVGLNGEHLDTLRRLVRSTYGIFFVTGATGSGKTTTLYSMLREINGKNINIMTLEDPVESRLDGINQAQINERGGFTFEQGLRAILRQDPNVIMVGEIRDYQTAEIAMRASLTGHLVLTTLHTINATTVVDRLFEMGTPPFLISSSMLGSMSQRLVRRLCDKCASPAPPLAEATINEFIKTLEPEEGKGVKDILMKPGGKLLKAVGCPDCRSSGYSGRLGLFELMIMNEYLRTHILAKSQSDLLRRTAVQTGMKTLLMDGALKAWMGLTTLDEVVRVTATIA